jgi:serine/threonine-protein kinase RsbW
LRGGYAVASRFTRIRARGMLATFGLRLRARAEFGPLLRERLRMWLDEAGTTKMEKFEIVLATTEAFANAVEHPQEPTSHLVDVVGAITDHNVTISIRDYGTWKGHHSRKKEGGRGLAIMHEPMDGVQFERLTDGTTVTMRRRLTVH